MNKGKATITILENVAMSLKTWQYTCQDWKELPTLEELNDIYKLMRENMELLGKIVNIHIERMKQ